MIAVNYALICDLVRREDSGKFILVGVYTGGIRFLKDGPTQLPALYAFVSLTTALLHLEISFRIIRDGEETPVSQTDAVLERVGDLEAEGEIILPVPFSNLHFEIGKHRLEFRHKEGDWEHVLNLDISVNGDVQG
jgi:hypothetical protein